MTISLKIQIITNGKKLIAIVLRRQRHRHKIQSNHPHLHADN
jgi:hypothetical protein